MEEPVGEDGQVDRSSSHREEWKAREPRKMGDGGTLGQGQKKHEVALDSPLGSQGLSN